MTSAKGALAIALVFVCLGRYDLYLQSGLTRLATLPRHDNLVIEFNSIVVQNLFLCLFFLEKWTAGPKSGSDEIPPILVNMN